MIDALCAKPTCKAKATHYGKVIWSHDDGDHTDYLDGYFCEPDVNALPAPGQELMFGRVVIETERRELPD